MPEAVLVTLLPALLTPAIGSPAIEPLVIPGVAICPLLVKSANCFISKVFNGMSPVNTFWPVESNTWRESPLEENVYPLSGGNLLSMLSWNAWSEARPC